MGFFLLTTEVKCDIQKCNNDFCSSDAGDSRNTRYSEVWLCFGKGWI